MSRTYHHGNKAMIRRFGYKFYPDRPPNSWMKSHVGYVADPTPCKKKRTHDHWHWMHDPSWWIREVMTVRQRAQTRLLINQTLKLTDLEEAPEFPLWNKPYFYYW